MFFVCLLFLTREEAEVEEGVGGRRGVAIVQAPSPLVLVADPPILVNARTKPRNH